MNRRQQAWIVFALLLGIDIVGRLLSKSFDMWNFTPVAAVGLFAGFFFERKLVAALLTIAAMSLTNWMIDGSLLGAYGYPGVMLTVYAGLLFPIALQSILKQELTASRVLGCALASSVVFFVTTNFAHWWCAMPHTLSHLCQSYVQGLWFFRMTLAGDLCFSSLLFGGYVWGALGQRELAVARSPRP